MKNNFKILLLFLISAILLSALLLFVYRQKAFSYLSDKTGIAATDLKSGDGEITVSETLDLSIFESPLLASLSNNVISFDFDNICRRPAAINRAVNKTTSSSEEVFSPSCALGNGLPFRIKTE